MTVRRPVLRTRMLLVEDGVLFGMCPAAADVATLAASSGVAMVCRLLLPRFIMYLQRLLL